jgi:hypothetical protein
MDVGRPITCVGQHRNVGWGYACHGSRVLGEECQLKVVMN